MGSNLWKSAFLGEVAECLSGKDRIPEASGERPTLTFKGLQPSGSLDLGEVISESEAKKGNMTALRDADVVVTAQGHATGWILKKVGYVWSGTPRAYAASTLQVIRAREGLLDSRFLYHYLTWPATYQQVLRLAGPRRSFTAKMFRSIPLWVPQIEEQERIASELDAVETLRLKHHEVLATLDCLTRSLQQVAFRRDLP